MPFIHQKLKLDFRVIINANNLYYLILSYLILSDIGGHEEIIKNLKKNLNAILHQPKGKGKLLQAPMGILLYGPPGCGM